MPGCSTLPLAELQALEVAFKGGSGNPGSSIVQPLARVPVTVKLGSGEGGMFGQMSMALPSTVPLACPLSVMLPLAQTSPVTEVVELPVNVKELPPLPPHPAGLNVWMAAPLVPALRATAVADAEIVNVGPAPRTCMIATDIE